MNIHLCTHLCAHTNNSKPVYLPTWPKWNALLGKYKISKLKLKVAQSCPTLCEPMDYTVHVILQVRIQEWVAFPFSRGSSQPRDQTQVSCTADRIFTSWATRELAKSIKTTWLIDMLIIDLYCFSTSTPHTIFMVILQNYQGTLHVIKVLLEKNNYFTYLLNNLISKLIKMIW